jgi:hypothetical protein
LLPYFTLIRPASAKTRVARALGQADTFTIHLRWLSHTLGTKLTTEWTSVPVYANTVVLVNGGAWKGRGEKFTSMLSHPKGVVTNCDRSSRRQYVAYNTSGID